MQNSLSLSQISLTIVFIFIVCHSVKWIPNIYELFRLAMDDKRSWPPWVECVTHIAHFLMTLNSSTNFYIYCGKHFNFIPKVQERNTLNQNFIWRAIHMQIHLIDLSNQSNVDALGGCESRLGWMGSAHLNIWQKKPIYSGG